MSSAQAITFVTPTLRAHLVFGSGGRPLLSLREALTQSELVAPGATLSWSVTLRDPEGNEREVECPFGGAVEGKGNECWLHWHPLPLPDGGSLSAVLHLHPGEQGLETRLAVETENTHWALDRITLLRLSGLPGGERARLIVPSGWGLESPIPTDRPLRLTYPSMRLSCSFAATRLGDVGLYLGAHDPARSHHQFIASPVGPGRFSLECAVFPTHQEASSFRQEFPLVLAGFRGGWYEAARLYRSWALLCPHAPQPLHLRPNLAPWVPEVDLWLLAGGSPEQVVPQALEWAEYFGVPCGVHWYNWHQIPFDDSYPEYFPTKPGFAEGVARLRQAGIRVVPYINGRLWDAKTDSFREEQAILSAAKKPDGTTYVETYASSPPLTVMCPYTRQWQDKIAGIVQRLVEECGVDGVYIDQICSAGPVRCFDPTHGHPTGGGHFWADGYRSLLQEVRRRLPPRAGITTEDAADFVNDLFDFMLAVGTPHAAGELVPTYSAAYSGHVLQFGFQYVSGQDWAQPLIMRNKFARSLLWGSQLGWIGANLLAPEQAQQAEYLRTLAQFRTQQHQYLVYGRMCAPPHIEGAASDLESVSNFGEPYSIHIPHVQGAVWESSEGKRGLILTNLSDAPEHARITIPADAQRSEHHLTEDPPPLSVALFPLR